MAGWPHLPRPRRDLDDIFAFYRQRWEARPAMTELWTQWEGQVVNGIYPLRRFLNASDHSSVFLTESGIEGFLNAAIKLVPADPATSEIHLWHWKTATTFAHPHLIRLLDSGQCDLQGHQFLFVVMEYAEENLSQVLPYRPLEAGEIRELLVPALDALAFLHRENWVQGQLKPSNILVVNDQLKLAADTIRPIGVAREAVPNPTIYDPPEIVRGEVSDGSDIWALGVTLVEALTQYPPAWPAGLNAPAALPADLPVEFREVVERCLSIDPAERPTVSDLQAATRPDRPATPGTSIAVPARSATAARTQTAAASGSTPAASGSTSAASVAASTPSAGSPAVPAAAPATSLPTTAASRPSASAASAVPSIPTAAAAAPTSAPTAAGSGASPAASVATTTASGTPEPPMRATPHTYTPSFDGKPESASFVPRLIAAVVLLAAVWGGWRFFVHSNSSPNQQRAAAIQQLPADVTPEPSATVPPRSTSSKPPQATAAHSAPSRPQSPVQPQPEPPLSPSSPASGIQSDASVVHEEIPKVPQSARNTIHGHIKVTVRVSVDRAGNVVRDTLETAGSSNYFNRLATQAARKWKFSVNGNEGNRDWLLRFEFAHDGTTAHAVRARS